MSDALNRQNYNLRDEIKAYWSARAATFDLSPGHEIFSDEERAAWHQLFLKHFGPGNGRGALDLASGTGVISHLLDDLGFKVQGLDWAEPMLERAREKAVKRGRTIRFDLGDAENTMEPDNRYDVVVTRHLVWTLVDPAAAFREWLRVLKPGGTLLVVDGDFVNTSALERLFSKLSAWGQRLRLLKAETPVGTPQMMETHRSILSRVHFSGGARAEDVAGLLNEAGFADVHIDTDLRDIHRTQAKNWNVFKGLARQSQHRYAIRAMKP
ncbi:MULTISPECIES: class I SAM-dependent methyltransferase [unclassified Ensifer]|uniref:class I SAM-dependent methyltransferase n=1 Tax=unclassified Ensifer TaxID=2633371 RepID=UPI000813CFB4|nr:MULTISPECIES: class I SAM-dependent methyltransferase [unclassified Ensifer]OCO99983.1 methyltransferase [Ensifer sp. LC13]OCP00080.1 methyltransferase [Ensifer sp. LC11]OCP04069.1 methyltransferase [Ensifer sp. LC14]OCP30968.1 methyltransferase [Ensifer sp. LC499]